MKNILYLALICLTTSVLGQSPTNKNPKIKLSGMVVDRETQQPLEYATISLRSVQNPETLQGGITGFDGKVSIVRILENN